VSILAGPGVNMLYGARTQTQKREEKEERVKHIHIRYKNYAVIHHKKFQKVLTVSK
jgi:hypothetical protein